MHCHAAWQETAEQQCDLAQVAVRGRQVGQATLGFADELGSVGHRSEGDAA